MLSLESLILETLKFRVKLKCLKLLLYAESVA